MGKAREIVGGRALDALQAKRLVGAIDELACDNELLLMELSRIANDGHLCEWSANRKISMMEPVACVDSEGRRTNASMAEWLASLGLTPGLAKSMVGKAHEKACETAKGMGFSAPSAAFNEWDAYWCMAMCLSDYWMTVGNDLQKAAMMAYEYLSDPDRILRE